MENITNKQYLYSYSLNNPITITNNYLNSQQILLLHLTTMFYHLTSPLSSPNTHPTFQSIPPHPHSLILTHKHSLRQGIKQLHFSSDPTYAVLLTTDSVLVYNLEYGEVTNVIRKLAYPRSVVLAHSGKFLLVHYSDNTVALVSVKDGREFSSIIGVPRGSSIFVLSKNSKKLLFGNNQQICLWDVAKAQIQVMTRQWKNINCYALSQQGDRFALGTYSGSIFVLTIVGESKVTEFEINRHSKCVMAVAFSGNNIVSISYDNLYLETIVETNQHNQKLLTYNHHQLQSIPRSLYPCSLDNKVYMIYLNGLFWLQGEKMYGFKEGSWSVVEGRDQKVRLVKYDKAEMQWYVWER